MSEKIFNPELNNEIQFTANEEWLPDSTEYHHEPRLAERSHELVNQALEVHQNDCEAIDSTSTKRFLKTYGIGPCILLSVSAPKKEQLGAVHFDANSNIYLLIEKLYNKLGIKNLNGFETKLIGGIREMAGSEDLKKDLMKFFKENNIKINIDNSMRLSESDYKDLYLEDSVPMLFYQSVIIDKKTGEMLSFNPFSDKIKNEK